jgi:selenocysteine lyase/cysteine desulfurase
MAGATAAVDFIAGLAPSGGSRRDRLVAAHQVIEEHELRLRRRIEEGPAIFHNRLTVHSVAAERTPTRFLTFRDKDAADAYRFLAARDVLAPAGTFYAYEPFRALNLEVDAGLRVGLAPYNDDSEIHRLLSAFEEFMHSH